MHRKNQIRIIRTKSRPWWISTMSRSDFEEMSLTKTAEHTRAFVKVQDGCNQFCSYCIIPYARGRVRSRNIESVLKEIRGLAKMGYQEVALAGIHLSSYGVDCEESLLHLIQEIHKIDGIRRIRLGSLEPQIVTEEFARELSSLEKICPQFSSVTAERLRCNLKAYEPQIYCGTV